MDQIKRGVAMLVSIDRLPGANALKEIKKRTGTDFSAVLARAGERAAAPVLLPIAKSVQSLSQKGSEPIPMSGSAHPNTNERFHERALGLRAYRQELLASNIANADTPGYKAVDIDITEAIRNGQSSTSKLQLKYQVPSQGSVDGNTVDMDVERAKFAENALMYEFEVDRVKGFYKNMDDLLKNTPY
jgi:flagellar basal-body rod protein FlgB